MYIRIYTQSERSSERAGRAAFQTIFGTLTLGGGRGKFNLPLASKVGNSISRPEVVKVDEVQNSRLCGAIYLSVCMFVGFLQ